MTTSGIVRANISNTTLKPEKNIQFNLGLDMSLLRNRLEVTLDYYNNLSKDVIFAVPLFFIERQIHIRCSHSFCYL